MRIARKKDEFAEALLEENRWLKEETVVGRREEVSGGHTRMYTAVVRAVRTRSEVDHGTRD
jgi:hypothetical protein